jgi:PTH1 family peptidyl-tRNA hydrolase
VRGGGGAGGHRGVESLIEVAGATDFVRVRVGVGRPPEGTDTGDFVLSAPSDGEAAMLDDACARAADAVEAVVADGLQAAMNRINQRETPHGGTPL